MWNLKELNLVLRIFSPVHRPTLPKFQEKKIKPSCLSPSRPIRFFRLKPLRERSFASIYYYSLGRTEWRTFCARNLFRTLRYSYPDVNHPLASRALGFYVKTYLNIINEFKKFIYVFAINSTLLVLR